MSLQKGGTVPLPFFKCMPSLRCGSGEELKRGKGFPQGTGVFFFSEGEYATAAGSSLPTAGH